MTRHTSAERARFPRFRSVAHAPVHALVLTTMHPTCPRAIGLVPIKRDQMVRMTMTVSTVDAGGGDKAGQVELSAAAADGKWVRTVYLLALLALMH